MILDSQNEFSDAQAVTATAISANVIDLFSTLAGGAAGPGSAIIAGVSPNARLDLGTGEDVYLIVNTAVAATDTGSDATLTITLESADDAALSVSPVVHFSTSALAFATFSPAGTNLVAVKLPSALFKRYLGVRYTVASGPLTAGAFDAFLAKDLQQNRIYRSAYTVQ